MAQTVSDIESIAVDDASTGTCPQTLDALAAGDSRLVVLHRPSNGGAAAARNDGLEWARGRYVMFVDADDRLHPEACERLVAVAEREQADITGGSWAVVDADGQVRERMVLPERVYDLAQPRDKRRCYRDLTFAPWNKLFRRSVIEGLRFEPFAVTIGEDTLFNVAAVCRAGRVATTAHVTYDYTVHPVSATGRADKGGPYLDALVASDRRIRDVLTTGDGSPEAVAAADWLALKRFATGCEWIAGTPDADERAALWTRWQQRWQAEVVPGLSRRTPLTGWCGGLVRLAGPARVARGVRLAMRLADPGRGTRTADPSRP